MIDVWLLLLGEVSCGGSSLLDEGLAPAASDGRDGVGEDELAAPPLLPGAAPGCECVPLEEGLNLPSNDAGEGLAQSFTVNDPVMVLWLVQTYVYVPASTVTSTSFELVTSWLQPEISKRNGCPASERLNWNVPEHASMLGLFVPVIVTSLLVLETR